MQALCLKQHLARKIFVILIFGLVGVLVARAAVPVTLYLLDPNTGEMAERMGQGMSGFAVGS